MYSENIVTFLQSTNWKIKKGVSKSFLDQLYNETKFLDTLNPLNAHRIFCVQRNIHSAPKCLNAKCNNNAQLNRTNHHLGFRPYCSIKCSTSSSKPIQQDERINYTWMYEQFITKKRTQDEIAKELNTSTNHVRAKLREYNILTSDARRAKSATNDILDSYDVMYELYVNQKLKVSDIAANINSSSATVSRKLFEHNIKTREPNGYDRVFQKRSSGEIDMFEWIQSIYPGEIISSNKSICSPYELDILIPEHNLAIEYNGVYQHSYKPNAQYPAGIKDSRYHLHKTTKCLDQNIQLLHFYSDEWLYKQDIVKSMISNKIKLTDRKVYARLCELRTISDRGEVFTFLESNHIQGWDKSNNWFGMYYNGELVSLMTFAKPRYISKKVAYNWELTRFCNKLNTNVVGGFSRLLKYARNTITGNIVSYADRRYSEGSVYKATGFNLITTNPPSYYYFKTVSGRETRFNRRRFIKSSLIRLGGIGSTEREMAESLGYNQIFDCGTYTFLYQA